MWWPQALKLWNSQSGKLNVPHKDVWAIPRKNTTSHEEVVDITKPGYSFRKAIKQLREEERKTKERNEERKKKAADERARREIMEMSRPKKKINLKEEKKTIKINIK